MTRSRLDQKDIENEEEMKEIKWNLYDIADADIAGARAAGQ